VYYDVFGPRVQPELWSMDMITAAYNAMRENGILVTYCAAGFVRRNMIAAGFTVERLPGPPGKREMLRAIKE
jgi:tRNA U34 5-methylaminomethyl-2-thiouridine-forming methyltransferase MnmC